MGNCVRVYVYVCMCVCGRGVSPAESRGWQADLHTRHNQQ
jgi:hypothetical protein